MRIKLLAAVAALTVTTPFAAHAEGKFDKISFDEISQVLQKYVDGTQYGKPELVEEAFLPSLEVQWVGDDNKLERWPGPDYISNIEKGKESQRYGRVISIDATNSAAMAKVELEIGDLLYTDYMLMLKVEGEWRIANKIAVWVEQD